MLLSFLILAFGETYGQNLVARDYFLLGAAKYKSNACEKAVLDFDKAISLYKDYADAYYGRSLSYLCLAKYKEALRDIETAIRLSPNEPLYQECKGRIKAQSGDFKSAVREFEVAVGQDSAVWQAWYGLANSSHALKDTLTARKAFDKAIHFNPKHAMAWYGRAKLRLEKRDVRGAMSDLNRAIELEASFAPFFATRAQAHLMDEAYELAAEDARTASRLNPNLADAFFVEGEALRLQGQFIKADISYTQAVKRDKNSYTALYMQGICRDSVRDYAGARKAFGAAIGKNKTFKDAYIGRANVWMKEGKPKKAVADLRSALKADKNDVELMIRLGNINLDMLEYEVALSDFQAATKKDPGNKVAWLGLGKAKFNLGNLGGACKDWEKAAELGSERAAELLQNQCQGK